jgi:hypothetical protein
MKEAEQEGVTGRSMSGSLYRIGGSGGSGGGGGGGAAAGGYARR